MTKLDIEPSITNLKLEAISQHTWAVTFDRVNFGRMSFTFISYTSASNFMAAIISSVEYH